MLPERRPVHAHHENLQDQESGDMALPKQAETRHKGAMSASRMPCSYGDVGSAEQTGQGGDTPRCWGPTSCSSSCRRVRGAHQGCSGLLLVCPGMRYPVLSSGPLGAAQGIRKLLSTGMHCQCHALATEARPAHIGSMLRLPGAQCKASKGGLCCLECAPLGTEGQRVLFGKWPGGPQPR